MKMYILSAFSVFLLVQLCWGKNVEFYLGIKEIDWTYSSPNVSSSSETYRKAVFIAYTDDTFSQQTTRASYSGILGPVLRLTVGDTLVVHLKNNASQAFSLYMNGLEFRTTNVDAQKYAQATHVSERVQPGNTLTYKWDVVASSGPTDIVSECATSLYYSNANMIRDVNSGLVGAIVVCKKDKDDVHHINLHFGTIYELQSWFKSTQDGVQNRTNYKTINGFTDGNLPMINVCFGRKVALHVTSTGGVYDSQTVVLYNHQFLVMGKRQDSLQLYPGAAVTAEFMPAEIGIWLLTSQHALENVYGKFLVRDCNLTRSTGLISQIRRYYITAEHSTVLSGRSLPPITFVEYTDNTFQTQKNQSVPSRGLLGPTIAVEEGDLVKVVFYNKADRDLSLFPHGLRFRKAYEGVFYDDGVEIKEVVKANSVKTYFWRVPEDVSPYLLDDPCLVRYYTSGIGHAEDTYLFGPLFVCSTGSLSWLTENRQAFLVYRPSDESADLQYEINGLSPYNISIPDLCLDDTMYLHTMSINTSAPQSFIVHENQVKRNGHVLSVIELQPNTVSTVSVHMTENGKWKIRSTSNENASMPFTVNVCGKIIDMDDGGNSKPYDIGIVEQEWDYLSGADQTTWKSQRHPVQMGSVYKKAVFRQFYTSYFVAVKPSTNGLIGPTLAINVGDSLKLSMENKASRSYSLHIDGLINGTIVLNSGEQLLNTVWKIPESIGPGSADPDCILKLYYSKTDLKDVPSGLVGPLIICSKGVEIEVSKNHILYFVGVIDETRSWYLEENIKKYSSAPKVDTNDPDFIKSNSIRVVNGYSNGRIKNISVPLGEDVYLHFANIGNQLETIHLQGINFGDSVQKYVGKSTVTLYPWATKTVQTRFNNIGDFLYEEFTTEPQMTRIYGYHILSKNTNSPN